ncbi:Hsp20/alpha crystallin family protein [Acidovorax sp. SUPP950]|uniref:Hsp20/alpha crystallin family protein n=1 Tax=unclassified Acidovorax TaxID=2684926 RepID=UPI0023D632C1|nr:MULTISPECIES: Hsp20/alpha crystallin family protein [Comamonadaceae]WOI45356.1 Hsp20/alpha crystallin family protein [Paracidovorax avenae]GKS77733.1 Hsp20/alpha crystallin family protein [Acidovorax sp. SUPP950]
MIFAPVIRRAAFNAPRSADVALQRFLNHTLSAPTAAGYTVQQDEKTVTLQMDLPGLSRDQLQLTIEGNQVRLTSVEGAPRQVQRAWELPADIDVSTSSAKLENGVLTLVLGKVVPVSRATQLTIA